jgi:hypothetical protein
MKPAEEFEPEELFAIEEATGSVLPQFKSGFPVDFAFRRSINGALDTDTSARLIQGKRLKTNTNAAADNDSSAYFDFMNGWRDSGADSSTLLSWMFRRAPGFFDVVTYSGNSVIGREIPHNLGAAPEMMWVNPFNHTTTGWSVYHKALGGTRRLILDEDGAASTNSLYWNNTDPTDQHFTTSDHPVTNGTSYNYIAMMWASVPGICDIGSFTGVGTGAASGNMLDVDCGFTNGARFVLVKCTSSAGDWFYADTTRGIVANSPTLQLNTTSAQSNTGYIQPSAGGFRVDRDLNTSGAEYIYMAIA